jgi:hypothetical protein
MMLQAVGFGVHFVPIVTQHLVQEHLQQAVMAQHFQGHLLAVRRQQHPAVLLVIHQRRVGGGQLLIMLVTEVG